MHPLDGPRLKITRAIAEIERLELAEEEFIQNTHYCPIKTGFNRKTQKDIYCVRQDGPSPPLEWGVYVGEIAHNLRSALDNLVYQLALLKNDPKTVAEDKKIQFPIFLHFGASKSNFRRDGKRMIRLLQPNDQKRIEKLQPYHRKNRAGRPLYRSQRGNRNNTLWWLREINNADKHRLIQVVGVKTGASFGILAHGDDWQNVHWFRYGILEDGMKILEAPRDVRVHSNITPLIAFANGCEAVRLRAVIFVLHQIAIKVYEIVESFSINFG